MGVIVLFLSFFVFIFVGSPIALALGGSALIYIVLFANVSPLIVMQQILASVNTYTLLAVPFFIMAGALMETGGISMGQTVVDAMDFYRKEPNAVILTEVDVLKFFKIFYSSILQIPEEKLDLLETLITREDKKHE